MEKITAYIALLRADGTEPDKASGYTRSCIGEVEPGPGFPADLVVPFPDVLPPGYREVTHWAMYDRPSGGIPLYTWPLPGPTTIHEGVVPVLKGGKLWKGVDVKARVIVKRSALCRSGGG